MGGSERATIRRSRKRAYRERKRAAGKKDRLYFTTDDQDRIIREFLERGQAPSPEVRIPEAWIHDKDKMAALRERLARAEQRFKGKDGEGLRMAALIGKLDDTHAKVLKDDHKDIQDLILLLASRTGQV